MIMKNTVNYYISDELANKVKVLTKALYQAESIIHKLEEENQTLNDALNNLASINKEDCADEQEAVCV